ncbi:MAG: GAF domain-containing protein [Chloroflexi bacterium]|nr:GAF domain-containing protein [Chloroflexota bacterium]
MPEIFAAHLIPIYFVYGLSFFVMGLVVALEARRAGLPELSSSLRYLAAFGLVHALVEWGGMFLLIAGGGTDFARNQAAEFALMLLLVISTSFLLYFGSSLIAAHRPRFAWLRWITPALIGVWLITLVTNSIPYPVLSYEWLQMGSVTARYVIYMPASILAAIAFFLQSDFFERFHVPRLTSDSLWAGIAFAFNSLVAVMVVPPAGYLPAPMVNYMTFFQTLGMPVQIYRSIVAFAVAFFVGRIVRVFEIENRRRLEEATEERLRAQQEAMEAHCQARETIAQWNQELEARIAERTRELERTNQELAAMNTVAGTVSQSLEIERILHDTLSKVVSVTSLKAGAIFLLNEWEDRLVLRAHYGLPPAIIAELEEDPLGVDSGFASEVLASGHPVQRDGAANPSRLFRLSLPVGSVAGIPLQVKGKVLGVIEVASSADSQLGSQDLELLTAIGQQIAVAIDNAQLFREAQRREREAEALLRVSTEISGLSSIETVLMLVVEKARQLAGAGVAGLGLADAESNEVVMKATSGARSEVFKHLRLGFGMGVMGMVAQSGRTMAVVDYLADMRIGHDSVVDAAVAEEGIRSEAAVPLRLGDRVMGVLMVGNRHVHQFTKDNCRLLVGLANQAAIALENARLYEEVQSYAIHEERDRIAREMHDGLAQVLGYFNVETKNLEILLDTGNLKQVRKEIREMNRAAQDAYTDVRESILGLRTSIPAGQEFLPSLREYVEKFSRLNQLRVDLTCTNGGAKFTPAAEVQLLRIVQEALTNVRKHAHATRVSVKMEPQGDDVLVTIEDNGVGFDLASVTGSAGEQFGLRTMRERAISIGGDLIVESTIGAGTRIIVRIPAEREGGLFVGTLENTAGR